MDNPQATKAFKLGYIACAIETDGTIGCHTGSKKYNNYYVPVIKIFNTNERFIFRVQQFLTDLEIPHHTRTVTPKWRNLKYRPCHAVTITGFKRVKYALDILLPSLHSKWRQGFYLKHICESRLSTHMTRGNQKRKWTPEQIELVNKLKEENALNRRKGEESSTTNEQERLSAHDRVSSA